MGSPFKKKFCYHLIYEKFNMGIETELCMFEVFFFPSKCGYKKF